MLTSKKHRQEMSRAVQDNSVAHPLTKMVTGQSYSFSLFAVRFLLISLVFFALTAMSKLYCSFKTARSVRTNRISFDETKNSILGDTMDNQEDIGINVTIQPSRRPFVLAAGHGTTGTSFLTQVMCHLGLQCVHWRHLCVHDGQKNSQMQTMYSAAQEFLGTYVAGTWCQHENATCPQVDEWIRNVLQALDWVIMSEVDVVLDFPYPLFAKHIIERATSLRGIRPVVLLTVRNPVEWAARRVKLHPDMMICRDAVELYRNGDSTSLGAFDVLACIERLSKQNRLAADSTTRDLFISIKILSMEKNGQEAIGHAMERYQRTMRELADFHINVFEQTTRVTGQELVKMVVRDAPSISKMIERRNMTLLEIPKGCVVSLVHPCHRNHES